MAEYAWPVEHPLAERLRRIENKLDLIILRTGVVMADVAPLTAVIEELDTDEVAAVDEFKALAEQIAQLTTEKAPSQAELDALTAKATAIATALKAGTPAAPVAPGSSTGGSVAPVEPADSAPVESAPVNPTAPGGPTQ